MDTFTVQTKERCELINITEQVQNSLKSSNVLNGFGVVYLMHTTAGLTINDYRDPDVAHDLLLGLERLVPSDQPGFWHKSGESDAHIKASLMGSSLTVMVERGELALGHWQGIFLCEFDGPRARSVKVTWMVLEAADKLNVL
jgi:secondary thiamine-phosphate synthase enzyme